MICLVAYLITQLKNKIEHEFIIQAYLCDLETDGKIIENGTVHITFYENRLNKGRSAKELENIKMPFFQCIIN